MTTTAPTRATNTGALVDRGQALSLGKTLRAESRKGHNTRSGKILLVLTVLGSVAFAGGRMLVPATDTDFGRLASMGVGSVGTLVAIVMALLVSAEFSVPTAPLTFTADPSRRRVITAKFLVAAGYAAGFSVMGLLIGAAATALAPLATTHHVPWTADWAQLASIAFGNVFMAWTGVALALAFRNAPGPLVVILLWPTLALLASRVSDQVAEALAYVDLPPIDAVDALATHGPAQIFVSTIFWIVLPAAYGINRLLRSDI